MLEIQEETGLIVPDEQVVAISSHRMNVSDAVTGMKNVSFQHVYVFRFSEHDMAKLLIEEGEATGFELYDLDEVMNPSEEFAAQLVPELLQPCYRESYAALKRSLATW